VPIVYPLRALMKTINELQIDLFISLKVAPFKILCCNFKFSYLVVGIAIAYKYFVVVIIFLYCYHNTVKKRLLLLSNLYYWARLINCVHKIYNYISRFQ